MERKKNYVHLNEVIAKRISNVDGQDVYPVFDSITQIDGILMGDLIAYSDGFGNRFSLDEITPKIYH